MKSSKRTPTISDANNTVRECTREEALGMIAELGVSIQPPPDHGSYIELSPRHMPHARPLTIFNFHGRLLFARCLSAHAGPFPDLSARN